MQNNDNDWLRDLAQHPYSQKGFTPELKRKIMRELDRQRPVRHHKTWLAAAGCFIAMILVAGLLMKLNGYMPQTVPMAMTPPETAKASAPVTPPEAIESVLMIGLRNQENPESASYRTVMFAEQAGKMETVAEGDGILMPYGQQFWHIEQDRELSSPSHALTVRQVGKATPVRTSIKVEKDEKTLLDPKADKNGKESKDVVVGEADKSSLIPPIYPGTLLYAGNKYLTLEVAPSDKATDPVKAATSLWTVDLKDYAAGATPDTSRVNLLDVSDSHLSFDNWGIIRERGKWQAVITSEYGGKNTSPGGLALASVMTQLSDSLANHNRLDRSWGSILALNPEAKDAICSPFGDMLAIFTDRSIEIYPAAEGAATSAKPLLQITKLENESLVMVQWANQNYADKWIAAGQSELTGKEQAN